MSRWPDVAPWGGPASDNFGDGDRVEREPTDRTSGCRGIAMHIAEGSYDGTVAWCRNPGSDISATFVSAKDGRSVQLVDTDDRPWTQGAGNAEWLSIEFEGRSGDALTPQQLEFAARVLAKAHQVYGVPLQATDSPSGRGLGWHGMGGAAWGGHTNCPGAPVLAQRPAIIARAKQIIEGDDMVLTDEEQKKLYGWMAYIVEVLGAFETGEPKMWTGKRVKAQDQLNALNAMVERPAVTLSEDQLAAIGSAAAAQAAEIVGGRMAELERRVELLIGGRVAAASAESDALAP